MIGVEITVKPSSTIVTLTDAELENDGFVNIVHLLIKNPSAPSVELHHAHRAFVSSRLVV